MIDVFFLPFAGASKYSYRSFQILGSQFGLNIIPIELPGRNTRIEEPLLDNIHHMTNDVFEQVKDKLPSSYVIYGHSMGGMLSYLVAKQIVESNLPAPIHLFVSGCGGPSTRVNLIKRHLLGKEEFLEELVRMGGLPEEILQNKSLIEFFEPILRKDFQAVDSFNYTGKTMFDFPITCMIGRDEQVTLEDALSWKNESVKEVDVIEYDGNHFFIFNKEAEILSLIAQKIMNPLVKSDF